MKSPPPLSSSCARVSDRANRLWQHRRQELCHQAILRTSAPVAFVDKARERTEINAKIGLLTQSYTGSIDNIGLFLDDGRRFKFGQFSAYNQDFSALDWYRTLHAAQDFTWLGLYDTSQALHTLEWNCLVGGTALRNMKTNRPCGAVVVEISTDTLAGIVAPERAAERAPAPEGRVGRQGHLFGRPTRAGFGSAVESRTILDLFHAGRAGPRKRARWATSARCCWRF